MHLQLDWEQADRGSENETCRSRGHGLSCECPQLQTTRGPAGEQSRTGCQTGQAARLHQFSIPAKLQHLQEKANHTEDVLFSRL